jgi:hypothetical protein
MGLKAFASEAATQGSDRDRRWGGYPAIASCLLVGGHHADVYTKGLDCLKSYGSGMSVVPSLLLLRRSRFCFARMMPIISAAITRVVKTTITSEGRPGTHLSVAVAGARVITAVLNVYNPRFAFTNM